MFANECEIWSENENDGAVDEVMRSASWSENANASETAGDAEWVIMSTTGAVLCHHCGTHVVGAPFLRLPVVSSAITD